MTGNNLRDWNATPQYGDGAAFIRCHDPNCPCQSNPNFLRDPLPPAGQGHHGKGVKVPPSQRVVQDDPNTQSTQPKTPPRRRFKSYVPKEEQSS